MKKIDYSKLYSFPHKFRKDATEGFVVDQDKERLIIWRNSHDYILDGFVLLERGNILSVDRRPRQKFTEAVLKLKYKRLKQKAILKNNLESTLLAITKKYKIIFIEQRKVDIGFVGKFIKLENKVLYLKSMGLKGEWEEVMEFPVKSIQRIEFNSDYLNALLLYRKHKYRDII
ncbi:hypothetical protein EHQ52_15360 [Leptospira koniambonensis]|uniref:Uncharacterized protein n=1 Tax=Leptospira koniambonensis TaxID=2484950 RepID=A0A4R9J3Y0_9LEPT|nr:hypothetical protein [Leptospira koniambonensis]TGL31314.1 hypothetical protein EHQ52_15360 [Leptospira koniambonensis]